MTAKQRISEIVTEQHDSISAVLAASQALVDAPEAFDIDGVDALLKLRADHIDTISELDRERISLAETDAGTTERPAHPAMSAMLEELADVDKRLQRMMQRRQIVIVNSMASMRNRVNFSNLADGPRSGRAVLDVMR